MADRISLNHLIIDYHRAKKAWQDRYEADDTTDEESREWVAFEAAENAVLFHPCETLDDVRVKASFVLGDTGAHDSLRNCYALKDQGTRKEWALTPFLLSLLGPVEDREGGR